jgi:outer membrane protein
MATPMEFEGNGEKNLSFKFGNQTFNASVPFYSRVQLDHYDVALFYGVPLLKTASLNTLNIDLGINARFLDVEARVDQAATGLSESTSETFVLPMVFAAVQITPVKAFSIEAEARGISYSGDKYYDLIGRLRVKVAGPLFIAGGYRYEDLDIDEKDIRAEVKVKGPFLETGLSF